MWTDSYPTKLPTITAVFDHSSVTVDKLKEFLYIPAEITVDDFLLGLALDGAKEIADLYCNNPFENDAGVVAIPASVEIGVLQYAAFVADRESPGITSRRTDLLAETYGGSDQTMLAIQNKYWSMHRLNPGL